MSLILSIDDKQLELAPETVIAYTFQANNIGQLQNPNSNYSNIFKVPFTAKNHIAFENARNINSTTNIPYQNIKGSLSNNGLNIVTDGIATLEDVSGSYNLRLNSGNIDFFSLLGESVVSRLYDGGIYGEIHQWNLTNIFNSRENNEGYIYPFIDWNTDSLIYADSQINIRTMLPCLFVKSVFDRIKLATDFNIKGTFIESERFQKLLLTPDTFTYTDEISTFIEQIFNPKLEYLGYNLLGTVTPNISQNINEYFFYGVGEQLIFNDGFGDFLPPMNGTFTISWDINPFIRSIGAGSIGLKQLEVFLYLETGTVILQSNTIFSETTSSDVDGNYKGSFIYNGGVALSGNEFKVGYKFTIQENISTNIEFGFDTDSILKAKLNPGPTIQFDGVVFLNQMFQIKQKDLIFDLMNQHALVCQTNNISKTIEFNYFDDLISNLHLAKDWSNKVDPNSLTLNFSFGEYAKKNNFKYKENETVTSGFGDSFITISDENLKDEATAVQLFTTATESLIEGDLTLPNIKSFVYNNLDPATFTGQNNRILILNKIESENDIEWTDVISSEFSNIVPLCSFEPLGFEDLIPENYETLQRILDKTKGITLMMKINELDLNELDFLIPIYLHVQCREVFLTGNFYLNKIEQYTGGKYTKCELFRI